MQIFRQRCSKILSRHRGEAASPSLFGNALLVACGVILFSAPAFATPTDDIVRAVAVSGAADVSQARPRQFLRAFTAIVSRTQPRDLPDYVAAAVTVRPDLSPKIVAVALKAAVQKLEAKQGALGAIAERIIRAAIAANPDAAVAIAKASIEASPALRHYVVIAAVSAAPNHESEIRTTAQSQSISLALLTLSRSDSEGFSMSSATLSPANLSDLGGSVGVNSPEQPPTH